MTDPTVVVSVVIPAFNSAAFIERTLDGVHAQSFTGHETVVVDDGSSDSTADLAAAYLSRHGMRGRIVRQNHSGIAAARNAGMRAAAGAFVALLDSDDIWYPEKLSEVLAEFERHPEAELVCHDENVTRDGRICRVSRRRMPRESLYDALLFAGNILSPSATVVRREAALALGGFDERPEYHSVEDYDFWLRFSRARAIRFLNRVLGEYILHDRSASRRIVGHHVALEGMLRSHLEEYRKTHPGLMSRLRVRRRLARVYRSAARQLIAYGENPSDQRMFVVRMLGTYPLELRNVAVGLLWMVRTVCRPNGAKVA